MKGERDNEVAIPRAYHTQISPMLIDILYEKILQKIIIEKKFLDRHYSATQLAKDLQTHPRYISAALARKAQANYNTFVNKLRIQEAVSILRDPRRKSYTIQEIADAVGFSNRQSFYKAFTQITGHKPGEERNTEPQ